MKKYFIAILFLSSSIKLFAQANILDIEINNGATFSNLRGDHSRTYTIKANYTYGFSVQYNFKKIISLSAGLCYENIGASTEDSIFLPVSPVSSYFFADTERVKDNYQYVTIPLLVKATFGKRFNYFLEGGTSIGILLEHIWQAEGFGNYTTYLNSYNKKTNIALLVGAGLSYSATPAIAFSLSGRYSYGLTNVIKSSPRDYDYDFRSGVIKTNSVSVLLGVAFKFLPREKHQE